MYDDLPQGASVLTSPEITKNNTQPTSMYDDLPQGASVLTSPEFKAPSAPIPYADDTKLDNYETPKDSIVGKDSNYLDSIAKFGKDFVNNAISTFTDVPKAGELALNRVKNYGASTGELAQDYLLNPIVNAVGGKPFTYYSDVTDRLDKENKALNEKYNTGFFKATDLADLGTGIVTGGLTSSFKLGLGIESYLQGVQQESGNKVGSSVMTYGTGYAGGKLVEKTVDLFRSNEKSLLKEITKLGDIRPEIADKHYSNYASVIDKDVKSLTNTDKINALMFGNKNLDSVLNETASKNSSLQSKLNNYYSGIGSKVENLLGTGTYDEVIANVGKIDKDISKGYDSLVSTLNTLDYKIESRVPSNIKELLSKAVNTNATDMNLSDKSTNGQTLLDRFNNVINDEGTIGDFYEVGQHLKQIVNKKDKQGTLAYLNSSKDTINNYFDNTFAKSLDDNNLGNIKQSKAMLDELYKAKMKANKKNLVKILSDDNVRESDYTKVYQAMQSSKDTSSYANLSNLLGDNSKALANLEKFVIGRLADKNKDSFEIVHLSKLLGDMQNVNFRSKEGKEIQNVVSSLSKAFTNIRPMSTSISDNMIGGAKTNPLDQAQAFAQTTLFSKMLDLISGESRRRNYVVKHLPKYLEKGEMPKGLNPKEQYGLTQYKNILDNADYLLAETMNDLAVKSKELDTYSKQFAQQNLLPNNNAMTAGTRGNVGIGQSEEVANQVIQADDLTRSPNAQPVNSLVNENQSPTREVIDTTIEPQVANNIEVPTSEIIDVEVNPSLMQVITPDGHIIDMETLMSGRTMPDSLKLPEKLDTPIRNFFDTKLQMQENSDLLKIRNELEKATTSKSKQQARDRYIKLLQYNYFRDSGMKPKEANNAVDISKGLLPLGLTGAYLSNTLDLEIDTEKFLEDYL